MCLVAPKFCSRCKQEKPITEFVKCSVNTSGYGYHCKECDRLRVREEHANLLRTRAARRRRARTVRDGEYAKNRDRLLQNTKNRNALNRWMALTTYGGTPPRCACCGTGVIAFLQIDHIHGGGNEERKAHGGGSVGFMRSLKQRGYPSGYQVLCANCNIAKHRNGSCPHPKSRVKDEIPDFVAR